MAGQRRIEAARQQVRRPGAGLLPRLILLCLPMLILVGCGRIDAEQVRICRAVIAALDRGAGPVEMLPAEADPENRDGVIVRYRRTAAGGSGATGWVRCRFAGGGLSPNRGELVEVATDSRGRLSDVELFMLRRFWLGRFETQAEAQAPVAVAPGGAAATAGYALQQAVNALITGCIYDLLASAYTLVFAIVSRINMAFGEFAMVGAYGALVAVHSVSGWIANAFTPAGVVPTVLAATLAAALIAALLSWTTGRVIVRALSRAPSQPVLIATVGLAILLQEAVRLSQGAREPLAAAGAERPADYCGSWLRRHHHDGQGRNRGSGGAAVCGAAPGRAGRPLGPGLARLCR